MNKNYKNSYKATEKELVSLAVYNVGYEKCNPCYQWGPGIRDHYLIHYVISGHGSLQVNQKTYLLSPGDSFLIYPGTETAYTADARDPWEYAWVEFDGLRAAEYLGSAGLGLNQPVYRPRTPAHGESLIIRRCRTIIIRMSRKPSNIFPPITPTLLQWETLRTTWDSAAAICSAPLKPCCRSLPRNTLPDSVSNRPVICSAIPICLSPPWQTQPVLKAACISPKLLKKQKEYLPGNTNTSMQTTQKLTGIPAYNRLS